MRIISPHVEKQIVEAVKAADAARKAVTVRIGSAALRSCSTMRREPYVKHDELIALEFRDKENKPAGLVVQWNCHPETLGGKNTQISADFVGCRRENSARQASLSRASI